MINQDTALIVFIIIIIISFVIALSFGNYASFESTWIHTFIFVLLGLGVIITFLFYYAVVTLSLQEQELDNIQEISRVNDTLLNNVFTEIKASSTLIPNFIYSITPLTSPNISNILSVDEITTPLVYAAKMTLSSKIFSLWEGVVTSHKILQSEHFSYITEFLQRANSKQLHELWIATKLNYNLGTQIYGDLLFEYGLQITEQKPESYIMSAKLLCADTRYIKLFS